MGPIVGNRTYHPPLLVGLGLGRWQLARGAGFISRHDRPEVPDYALERLHPLAAILGDLFR